MIFFDIRFLFYIKLNLKNGPLLLAIAEYLALTDLKGRILHSSLVFHQIMLWKMRGLSTKIFGGGGGVGGRRSWSDSPAKL